MKKYNEAKKISDQDALEIMTGFGQWMESMKEDDSFVSIAKAFHNWAEKTTMTSKNLKIKMAKIIASLLESAEVMTDLEKQQVCVF